MDKSVFPDLMGFAGIGSRIYMISGYDTCKGKSVDSRNVSIYDTLSSTLVRGPLLNSSKVNAYLFTIGSNLYALSCFIYSSDFIMPGKQEIQFEMLDTSDPEGEWCALPVPRLLVSQKCSRYHVDSVAAVSLAADGKTSLGDAVFISLKQARGTYVYDIDNQIWNYASDEVLPFVGLATKLPHAPSLCCGFSLKTGNFCAFQLRYGDNGFRVKEIKIHDPYRFSTPLPPHMYSRPLETVIGPNGRLYFVESGVDKPHAHDTFVGNRYVKISALEFSIPKVGLSEVESLRCNKKRKGIQGQTLGRCNEGKKGKEGLKKLVEVTGLWRMCFDGGPICNPFIHVEAAFAM
ncbi:uncharacterized protein LOC141609505 [Silene latifolia]|uniref:uncharacterized protein LOC141609505 n=1 Tax=Silene latifolia TaxID=37657 RepID=UPI003D76CAF7